MSEQKLHVHLMACEPFVRKIGRGYHARVDFVSGTQIERVFEPEQTIWGRLFNRRADRVTPVVKVIGNTLYGAISVEAFKTLEPTEWCGREALTWTTSMGYRVTIDPVVRDQYVEELKL